MSQGLAYPATFGNGLQPKRVGLSDFLDANQSFVDKAQSINQIRDVVAPQVAKQVAPQAQAKAQPIFKAAKAPAVVSKFSTELDNSEQDYYKQLDDYYTKLADPEYGYDANEIAAQKEQAISEAKQEIDRARKEAFKEAKQFIDKSDLSPNQKKITNIQTKELTNQPLTFGESLEQPAQKAVGLAQKFTQPIVQTVGDVAEAANIPNMLMQKAGIKAPLPLGALNPISMIPDAYQQVTGQNPLTQVSDFASKLAGQIGQSEEFQDVEKNNPIASGVASLLGNAAPYVIAPETAFGRGVGAMATRGVRNLLPMASKPVQNFVAKAIGAGVREAIQDTPLSAASTLGNLAGGVRRDELSLPEAMKQAPSQLAINAAGDFVGAGVLRGAGDLAGKALKGQIKLPEMPKTETVRGEGGANAVLERPTAAKPSNDFNMSETYRQIGQEMEKAGLLEQAAKFYKKADANDPLLVNAKLKKQKGVSQVQKRIAEEEANLQKSQQAAPDSNIPSSPQAPLKTQPLQSNSQELDRPQALAQDSNLGQNTQTGKADVLDELWRYKSLKQDRAIGGVYGDRVTLNFASKEQKALYELGRSPKNPKRFQGSQESKNAFERAQIRDSLKNRLGVDDAELENLIKQTRDSIDKQVKARETSDIKLKETIPKKPIIPDAPKTQNPIIPDAQTGKAGGQSAGQIKNAQKDLKNQYSEVLNKETAVSEKPVRDGLEELGFEIKSNAKGEKYAQLGNVKVALKDIPPPYSLNGLKSSLKEKIASAKAAKDIQTGKVSDIEGIRSEFLDDAQASKYLDELDGEALYQEKQFIDSIKNAKSKEELGKIYEDKPDLFTYDSKTAEPSKYMKEYEARQAQLESPVKTVDDLAKTATEPIDDYEKVMAEAMLKADPRSFRSGKPPDVKDWTEFQQKYRNPENYNTLDKQIDTKLKPRQQNIINELASTQQVRTNIDKTVKKANRELTKLLKPNESVSIQVGKNTYTFTRKDTEIVLNAKGQAELQRALDDFNEGREPELKQSKDSLNVQVKNVEIETPRISQQTKEGLAKFIVEKSLRYANVDKEYDALKVEFDNNFKPDELFGKVWTDKNSTATFHVSKGALRDSDFNEFKAATTKELKGSKAFTEEAKLEYPKTVKEGRLPPTSTKRAQEAIKQRLDMAEVKKEGVNTVEDIEAISKEFEGVKEKVKKSAKGKSFADAGIIIAALKLATGDPVDAVLSGVRAFGGFNKLAEKTKSKGLYEAAELADAFLGMQRGIETRLMDIDHPAVKKFSDIYKKMAAQEFTIRGKMNSAIDAKLVNPDELELVKKFFQENSPETIDALFAQHGAIEGITNPAAYAYAEAINDIKRARKEVLGAITKSNALPDNAKKAFETLFALDDSVYGQVHSKVNAFINDTVYKTALAYRLSSIPTILTDVPMKTGTTQGFRNTIGAVGDFLSKNPKVVNSELFKSFKAERMGNSWNQELSILAKTSKNPVFRTLQELAGKIQNNPLLGDWFSNTTSGIQNIGLIAIAKRFEQKYNKLNNTKIDIFKEYNGSNDVSREFALYANEQLNDLHNAGVGSLAKSGVSGNQLLKPLLFLKSESLRYQNLENKLMQQMKTGSEEVKREAFFAFTKYKMAQLLLGGTAATGIGAASNLFLSYLTPEQQDNYKESMNYLNIGRLLNVDLTEKLNSAIIQRKPGQSFYEAARSTFDEMKNPIVQAVLKFPDAINNWEKAQKNGDIAGQIKALTAPLPYASGLGDLMAKAVRQYKGEFQPFYVQTAPGKFEQSAKEFEVSDYAGKSWKIHNAQEMADYERGAKELVMKIGVEKQGTLYKLTKDSAELNSYLNVLIKPKFYNDDPEMQKIANLPDGTPAKERVKNDIKAELLKSAYTSVNAKARTDAAKAPVSSPAYWANAKEDSIESTYKLFARSNPEKAKQIIKEAQKMASKNRKKVLARLTAN